MVFCVSLRYTATLPKRPLSGSEIIKSLIVTNSSSKHSRHFTMSSVGFEPRRSAHPSGLENEKFRNQAYASVVDDALRRYETVLRLTRTC